MVNGEIFNWKELYQYLDFKEFEYTTKSHSDCEVILHLFTYITQNIEYPTTHHLKEMCEIINGEFAFVIYDIVNDNVYYAVDELRVRPLFYAVNEDEFYLSSEQKAIPSNITIHAFPPGTVGVHSTSSFSKEYFSFNPKDYPINENITHEKACTKLRKLLIENVRLKLNPERDYAFLLSGGLDSSLICGIAARLQHPSGKRIRTFTVGFDKNAPDVIAAQKVANHIDSIHEFIQVSFEDGISIIPDVIKANESWDQTTTRASVPMVLATRHIKSKYPEIIVIYSGEVADELLCGYLYNLGAPTLEELRNNLFSRLQNITYFDGLRADRTIASLGCELRLPFFSKDILKFVFSLPPKLLSPKHNKNIEKYLLRKAFDGLEFIPQQVLWRTKNAFSDATSLLVNGKSEWKEIIKKEAEKQVSDSRFECRQELYPYCTPQTKEDMWYREIFDELEYTETTIPNKWMPMWVDSTITDSSATALNVYHT